MLRQMAFLTTDLSDAVILLLQGGPRSWATVVVVVGGIWFGCFWLLVHHRFDRCHVDRSVPDSHRTQETSHRCI